MRHVCPYHDLGVLFPPWSVRGGVDCGGPGSAAGRSGVGVWAGVVDESGMLSETGLSVRSRSLIRFDLQQVHDRAWEMRMVCSFRNVQYKCDEMWAKPTATAKRQ